MASGTHHGRHRTGYLFTFTSQQSDSLLLSRFLLLPAYPLLLCDLCMPYLEITFNQDTISVEQVITKLPEGFGSARFTPLSVSYNRMVIADKPS
jgi:hypothetical protein